MVVGTDLLTQQGVKNMRRVVAMVGMALVLSVLPASLLFAGCGSADSGDYQQEVSTLNKEAAEKLEEALHPLGEEGHGEEVAGGSEAVVVSLEEAVLVMEEALTLLEEIRVPVGWEDYHRDLAAFYHANLAAYEGYLAALAPGEEHAEGKSHEEEESAETHEEETAGEEEAPHEGETPQQQEEPAESGGH